MRSNSSDERIEGNSEKDACEAHFRPVSFVCVLFVRRRRLRRGHTLVFFYCENIESKKFQIFVVVGLTGDCCDNNNVVDRDVSDTHFQWMTMMIVCDEIYRDDVS